MGHFRLDNEFVSEGLLSVLSNAALKVFLSLNMRKNNGSGKCFPSLTRLQKDSGLGRKAVVNGLMELKEIRLVEIVKQRKGKTNTYRIIPIPEWYHKETSIIKKLVSKGNQTSVFRKLPLVSLRYPEQYEGELNEKNKTNLSHVHKTENETEEELLSQKFPAVTENESDVEKGEVKNDEKKQTGNRGGVSGDHRNSNAGSVGMESTGNNFDLALKGGRNDGQRGGQRKTDSNDTGIHGRNLSGSSGHDNSNVHSLEVIPKKEKKSCAKKKEGGIDERQQARNGRLLCEGKQPQNDSDRGNNGDREGSRKAERREQNVAGQDKRNVPTKPVIHTKPLGRKANNCKIRGNSGKGKPARSGHSLEEFQTKFIEGGEDESKNRKSVEGEKQRIRNTRPNKLRRSGGERDGENKNILQGIEGKFETKFWHPYPRRPQGNKKIALSRYKKIPKKSLPDFWRAVKNYFGAMEERENQYIKYADGFMNPDYWSQYINEEDFKPKEKRKKTPEEEFMEATWE